MPNPGSKAPSLNSGSTIKAGPSSTIKALPSTSAPTAKPKEVTAGSAPTAKPKEVTAGSAPNNGKTVEGVVTSMGADRPEANKADSAPKVKVIQGEVINNGGAGSTKPPTSPTGSTKPPTSPTGSTKPPTSPTGSTKPPTSPTGSTKPPTSPTGSTKPPTSPTGNTKPPTSPTGSQPGSGDRQVWPPRSATGSTPPKPGAGSATGATPPGVNMTKAGNPPQSVGGKFGNITTISNQSGNNVNGINVNGNQNQIHVSGSGNVFGGNVTNITINHNSPAAAPEAGAKGKSMDWGAFAKEVTKGVKDISDAGLKVIKEGYDGAVKTASK